MSEIWTFEYQTMPKSKHKPVWILEIRDFWDIHKMFGFQQKVLVQTNVRISDPFFCLKSKLFVPFGFFRALISVRKKCLKSVNFNWISDIHCSLDLGQLVWIQFTAPLDFKQFPKSKRKSTLKGLYSIEMHPNFGLMGPSSFRTLKVVWNPDFESWQWCNLNFKG